MLIGTSLLIGLFVFPMWTITLGAPQYPEPIGMNIWINKIEDMNPNDLKNINLMNHYVGMKEIPEHIKEFEYFPYIIMFMITLGFIFGFVGKPKLYLVWFGMMCVLGVMGMYDFWFWEYNYGHNLDSKAAIKFVDDLGNPINYQPPLIGTKIILNFVAKSMPSTGAYLLFASMFSSIFSYKIATKKLA